jgi:hypothetical protein
MTDQSRHLAGAVARGGGLAPTLRLLSRYRRREEEAMDGPTPQFGDVAKVMGEAWEDEGPEAAQALKARMQEIRQQRFAEGDVPDWGEAVPWVR